MERLPICDRELLIRYGKLAPHARDRVLDQFYLLVPGCSSLQRYAAAQALTLVLCSAACAVAVLGINSLLLPFLPAAFLKDLGSHGSNSPVIMLCLEVLIVLYVCGRRWRYQKRYKEKWHQTTEIGLSNERISLHARIIHGGTITNSLRWDELVSLELVEKAALSAGESLVFCDRSGKTLTLHLDFIQTIEERQILRDFIRACVTHLDVSKVLTSILRIGKPDDVPFTKLWCQALRDTRPRRSTAPLSGEALLQDQRFVIRDCIGGGGQGTVYEAEMRDLDGAEKVVLKEYVLPDVEHTTEHKTACEQFEKEIRLLGKVSHDGVIKLIDAFVEDHRAYLVLEHVDGTSLRDYVHKHGPLDQALAVRLAIQSCRVLEHLHSMKPAIMHLDFSPENILFDGHDRIVLIDFNISVEENVLRTRTVMGKQRYMAPEQYRGQPTTLSDVYSLGATLFYVLTGVEPEPISVAKPIKHKPDIDKELVALIARATALEDNQRFQSAEEFRNALSNLAFMRSTDLSNRSSKAEVPNDKAAFTGGGEGQRQKAASTGMGTSEVGEHAAVLELNGNGAGEADGIIDLRRKDVEEVENQVHG